MLHRRSIRLKNYDYSSPGAYFITLCTYNRQKIFGNISGDKMILNDAGEYAKACWLVIPDHYPDVRLDEWVIMPDHIHGILWIMESNDQNFHSVGVQNIPIHNRFQHIIPRSIGCIVRGFKIGVTKLCRDAMPGMLVWQRNYYEHIIRNDEELVKIRRYIQDNPSKWEDFGLIDF